MLSRGRPSVTSSIWSTIRSCQCRAWIDLTKRPIALNEMCWGPELSKTVLEKRPSVGRRAR